MSGVMSCRTNSREFWTQWREAEADILVYLEVHGTILVPEPERCSL